MAEKKVVPVTIISTVYNEEGSIRMLLDSLLLQEVYPKEIIFVDAGSKDKTLEILKEYKKYFEKEGISFRIIIEPGATIGRGRNIAIENADTELIASIDAGCHAHKKWLKNLYETYERTKADVVAGNTEPFANSFFQKLQALFVKATIDNPSSRSLLFKKSIWEKANRYPEDFNTGEDTLFNLALRKAGARFAFAKHATVYWHMRKGFFAWLKQFFRYGIGDGLHLLPGICGYRLRITLALLFSALFTYLLAKRQDLALIAMVAISIYYTLSRMTWLGIFAGILLPIRIYAYTAGYIVGIIKRITKR